MKDEELNKKELVLPDEHLAVFQIISNSTKKYVTRNMILAQLGKDFSYHRRLSQIINELVTVYKMRVGSSSREGSKGYFIIKTEYDKYLAKKDLSSRTDSILERYKVIDKIEIEGDADDDIKRIEK